MPLRWWESVKELFTRTRRDADLEREMQSHLDAEADDLIDGGVDPEEAPWAARRAFGNVTRAGEDTREAWRLETVRRVDPPVCRGPAARCARRRSRTAQAAGVHRWPRCWRSRSASAPRRRSSASIKNVLLDPYPMYADVDRMVGVMIHDDAERPSRRARLLPDRRVPRLCVAGDLVRRDHRRHRRRHRCTRVRTAPSSSMVPSCPAIRSRCSASAPCSGERSFPTTPVRSASPVFVMSYKLWANRFGMDASLVGQRFTLDGTPTTLIGVMPPRVSKMAADIWRPVLLDRADPAMQDRFFKFQARLKPGVTIAQADAEFRTVAARVAKSYPKNYPDRYHRPRHRLRGQHRPGLQDDALHDGGGRRPAPADRVRERREHAAQPRDGPPAGNRAAPRARREPRTDRAPAARREPRCWRCSARWSAVASPRPASKASWR